VADNTLAQVRGGNLPPTLPADHPGIILWDEKRVPPPPVRHMEGRVTAQMEITYK
jgi:hypothetical protein